MDSYFEQGSDINLLRSSFTMRIPQDNIECNAYRLYDTSKFHKALVSRLLAAVFSAVDHCTVDIGRCKLRGRWRVHSNVRIDVLTSSSPSLRAESRRAIRNHGSARLGRLEPYFL